MKCPKCGSNRLQEEEKTQDVYCESCGTQIEEPLGSEFREQLHEGHKEKKKKW